MDLRSIIAPSIKDYAGLEEFIESFADLVPAIERDISRLREAPDDRDVMGSLFRALHNIKGDATMSKVELAVAVAHPIETLVGRLRSGEVAFSDVLGEAVLLAIDRLELAVEALRTRQPLDNLRLPALAHGLERLAGAARSDIPSAASDLIAAVTGFRPVSTLQPRMRGYSPAEKTASAALAATPVCDDLSFFHSLADQLESRSPLFKGRTQRLVRLAGETNQLKDTPIDPVQLEAAVYMHDVGMMFLPESTWLKAGPMTPDEKALLRDHPARAAGLLARMPGWEEAARMVAQHHEMPDGRGYPHGLRAGNICDGAKLLAIIDAFESVMLKHAHRGKNRSVLRAVAEVNACDNQFAKEWIGPFNQVIQRSVGA